MDEQMKMFEEGGLYQEGGTTDPISGNEVPVGSLQEEVRDDIDAKLSEGEFVFPADVVRYIGLENLMKLRQKAKEGLAKMDDMGQMGNSEEAVVDDDEEYNAEIDALIDEFDPEAEDEMEFAEGGAVPDVGIPEAPKYDIPGFQQPRYRTGQTKSYEDLMGGTTPLPQYETKQYIGPNNDIISVTFLNGKPVSPIPEGYKPYKGEMVSPAVQQPTVTEARPDKDDKSREEQDAERQQYNNYLDRMNKLAELDPEFAKTWAQDPQSKVKPGMGLKETLANFTKAGGLAGGVLSTFQTATSAADARQRVAEKYGLNVEDYKVKQLGGLFTTFNEDALIRDAYTSKNIADSLSKSIGKDVDPKDLARTNLDSNNDGKITKEDLVDSRGNLTQAGKELFMEDIDIGDVTAQPTSRQQSFAAPEIGTSITGTQIRGPEADAARDDGRSDYDREVDRDPGQGRDDGSFGDDEGNTGYGGAGDFGMAKGGLLAPKTSRKPKTKPTNTRGKGLARKK